MNKKAAIIFSLFFLPACVTQKHVSKLMIGMDKVKVIEIMGEPENTGATGNNLEAWTYNVYRDKNPQEWYLASCLTICTLGLAFPTLFLPSPHAMPHYLYFQNGLLIQWGKHYDWQPPANQISEIRIR